MTIYIFKVGKNIDAGQLQAFLNSLNIKAKCQEDAEVKNPSWRETKKKVKKRVGNEEADYADSEIIIYHPNIRLEDIPEDFSFGNGVSVLGDVAWFVVDPNVKKNVDAVIDKIREFLGA
jgi:hypothetical protein